MDGVAGGGRRLYGALTGRVTPRVRPVVVGLLAAVDLSWQTLATLLPRLLETDVLPVAVSLLLGAGATLGDLPNAAPTILYAYLVYVLAPRVFPERARHVTELSGFRLLTAVNAAAVPLLAFTPGFTGDVQLLFGGLVVLPFYLLAVQGRSVLDREGYPVAFMNAFLPSEDIQAEYHEDPDVKGKTPRFWVEWGLLSVLSVFVTFLVYLIVGVLLVFLSLLYPVPELLLSAWVGQRWLAGARVGPNETLVSEVDLDLEARIVSLAGVATEGFKGFSSVLVAGAGFVFSVVFLYVVLFNVGNFVDIGSDLPSMTFRRQVIAFVVVVSLTVYSAYGVWYWLRMLSRVPQFLDAWRDQVLASVETPPERDHGALLTRPPGTFLPAVLLWVTLTSLELGTWEDPRMPGVPMLGAWAVALAATVWTAYRGLVDTPQPPLSDQRALPGSLLVHTLGFWLSFGGSLLLDVALGRTPVAELLATLRSPTVLMSLVVVVGFPYFFFYRDVLEWRRRSDWRRWAYVPYYLLLAAVVGVAAVGTSGTYRALLAAFLLVLLAAIVHSVLADVGVVGDD